MGKHTKIISLLLSLIMVISVFGIVPFSISAEEIDASATGADSGWTGDCTWSLDGTVLTISGSGKMSDYDRWLIKAPWGTNITEVILTDGVKSIGTEAFYDCTGLTSVKIGNSVTSIGRSAFEGCTGLTSINIPDSVTSIGSSAFKGCTGLTSINIPDSVTSIDSLAFYGCKGLTSINIPDSVTSIDSFAFYNCTGLTSIIIPDSVTSINEYVFDGCTGLTSVTISGSVTSIGKRAFEKCSSLTSLTIPDSVTRICEYAFSGCSGLTSVTIPDSVIIIDQFAFYSCTGLTQVSIPDSVLEIGFKAFGYADYGQNNDFTVYGYEGSKAETYANNSGFAFVSLGTSSQDPTSIGITGDCIWRIESTVLTISGNGEMGNYGSYDIGSSNYAPWCNAGITEVVIENGVTSIGQFAFRGCTELEKVTVGNSVAYVSTNAFYDCPGLVCLTVTEGNTIYDSRDNCNAIIKTETNTLIRGCQNTVIPDSVTDIGYDAFSNCSSLTCMTIPQSVTTIGYNAFRCCSGLESLTVAEGNTVFDSRDDCNAIIKTKKDELYIGCKSSVIPDSVTSIGDNAFSECTNLISITIPDSVTSIGYMAFSECTGLMNVTISNSVSRTGEYAFADCTGLTGITIPASVTCIDRGAFKRCTGLTNVTLPDSVKRINQEAFSGCTGLTSVNIPDSVTSIGFSAFYGCTGLMSITVPKSVNSIDNYAFGYYEGENWKTLKEEHFTIYGFDGSEAKTYADNEGFTFICLSSKTDDGSKVILDIPEDMEFSVDILTDHQADDAAKGLIAPKNVYNITLMKGDLQVQPENNVRVQIPCDDANAKVYRVEDNASYTDMNAVWRSGYLMFYTDRFSVYIVAQGKKSILGDVDGDGEVSIIDATAIQRHLASIPTYAYCEEAADVDGDGSVLIIDATCIQRHLAQLPAPERICNPIT